MEKYLVPAAPSPENPKPRRRHQWDRSVAELNGRLSSKYRHKASRLLLDSYAEVGVFKHNYHIGGDCCPTHLARSINAANHSSPILKREGVSGMEFDSKGIYLASVTKSGCLTVHDFETLYCSIYGPLSNTQEKENETKHLLHLSTSMQLDVVRWNPENQDEVVCASRINNKILLYDIGYISSEPVEVLEKGRSKFTLLASESYNGLSDIRFTSDGKSRLLASDLEGSIYIWDRRLSNLPCLELTTNSRTQLNSIQLDIEDRTVFGASKHGIIYAWDLRGGRTSFAFQSHNEVYHPLLASIKVSSLLEKITSLKAQSNILLKEIYSINLNPSCPYQLSFHLDDGWDGTDISASLSDTRKPSWLPASSIYAVPCSSDPGIYLLDFFPDPTSACHVDFYENISEETKRTMHNKFVHLSESVLVCAANPLDGTIVAGTKQSSLLIVSQRRVFEEV